MNDTVVDIRQIKPQGCDKDSYFQREVLLSDTHASNLDLVLLFDETLGFQKGFAESVAFDFLEVLFKRGGLGVFNLGDQGALMKVGFEELVGHGAHEAFLTAQS